MMCYKGKKRVLALFDSIPSNKNPYVWSHALGQFLKLSSVHDLTIISPVCFTVSLRRFKENKKMASQLPQFRYEIGNATCWRPRYIDFSLFPWKYRKHYIQIFSLVASLLLLILRKRINFDIIHTHFVYRPGYVATILGKIFSKPVIITAYGSDIHKNLYGDEIVFRKRTLYALRGCDKIITVSESLKKLVEKEGILNKTSIIPCGYSGDRIFSMDKKKCRLGFSLPLNTKIILFIGSLLSVKGLDILIAAFRILKNNHADMKLLLIGDCPEKKVLDKEISYAGLDGVTFLGRVDDKVKNLYINSADLLVVPSRNEGRPVVIFEALACGVPVVASHVGGTPETIVNNKLGILVEKENPVALADGINEALKKTWDTQYLSNYAKQFSDENITSKILKVYESVQ